MSLEGLNWQGRTAVCIASGPSLTGADVEIVRSSGHAVVVTNTTFRLCPWADALYAHDLKWWKRYHEEVAATFAGRKFCGSPVAQKFGAEWFASMINSGTCAISLAMWAGASNVVMLGFDAGLGPGGATHWHGDHPSELSNAGSISGWSAQFELIAKQARRRGVPVVNASRRTALTCFPRVELEEALC